MPLGAKQPTSVEVFDDTKSVDIPVRFGRGFDLEKDQSGLANGGDLGGLKVALSQAIGRSASLSAIYGRRITLIP